MSLLIKMCHDQTHHSCGEDRQISPCSDDGNKTAVTHLKKEVGAQCNKPFYKDQPGDNSPGEKHPGHTNPGHKNPDHKQPKQVTESTLRNTNVSIVLRIPRARGKLVTRIVVLRKAALTLINVLWFTPSKKINQYISINIFQNTVMSMKCSS